MRRVTSIEDDVQGGLDLTPLIDCVFLLLVFFMVTTVLKQPHTLKVDLPEARESVIVDERKLVATIDATGQMEINRERVALSTLRSVLAREQATTRSLTLVVRTDKETEHGFVLEMMEVAKGLGVDKIVLATDEPVDGEQ